MSSEDRRTMPLLPLRVVIRLTELTARQIRYYEEHNLIEPVRTEGNRRMFTLADVDSLLEIRDLLDQGINMAGIKKVFAMKESCVTISNIATVSYAEFRSILRDEIQQAIIMQNTSLR